MEEFFTTRKLFAIRSSEYIEVFKKKDIINKQNPTIYQCCDCADEHCISVFETTLIRDGYEEDLTDIKKYFAEDFSKD